MEFVKNLTDNYYYSAAIILFVVGFHTMLNNSNLIKKIIGMNIMDTAVFLLFISFGYIRGARAPIVDLARREGIKYVNPVPTALMLTGIVVAVSITAFALALTIRLYDFYGTIDIDEITRMRRQERQ
jgi:multicomponent Na+:H+ antiporter subunit C